MQSDGRMKKVLENGFGEQWPLLAQNPAFARLAAAVEDRRDLEKVVNLGNKILSGENPVLPASLK